MAIEPVNRKPLTADEFNAVVSAVTNAFGDPTRREIYLFARDDAPPASPPARWPSSFDLHPNVARHHLEKLTGGGYLVVEIAQAPVDGTGARRGPPVEALPRRSELDATLALPAQARRPARRAARPRARRARRPTQAEALADEVGFEYGLHARRRAWTPTEGHRSVRAALAAVADALTAHGFAAHTEAQRRPAHDRVGVLPVRRDRAAVPARRVRARPRDDPRRCSPASTARRQPQFETSRPDGDDHCVARV